MSFSFNAQLRQGSLGENIFYQAHAGSFSREDGRKRDFSCATTGDGIELKTDTYDMDKTPFFFIERFSDMDKQSPGGAWQALANGNKWFYYFFIQNLTYYKFETEKLVAALELLIPECATRTIPNKTWTTLGYKVPRAALSDIYKEVKLTITCAP